MKVNCPQCGKEVNGPKGMQVHLNRTHGIVKSINECEKMRGLQEDPVVTPGMKVGQEYNLIKAAQERRSVESLILDLDNLQKQIISLNTKKEEWTQEIDRRIREIDENFVRLKSGEPLPEIPL